MLIIARHTRTRTSRYHDIDGLKTAAEVGADIFSIGIRLTKDNRLVLSRHVHLFNNRSEPRIRSLTLKQLQSQTEKSSYPTILLDSFLKQAFGVLMLEIVVEEQAAVEPLLKLLAPYIKRKNERDSVLISSSSPFTLLRLRRNQPKLNLGMVHRAYPFTFLTWEPLLRLSAVGFHRLHINSVAVDAAHQLKLMTYAYSVNRKHTSKKLQDFDIDAIATETPEVFS